MVWEVGVVFVLAAFAAVGSGTRCFECTDVPHPSACTRVATCVPGEMCAVDEFITTGGLVLYNTGCRSTVRCSAHIGTKRETSRVNSLYKRNDVTICQSCCQGDFCNNEGCGSKAALTQPQRGPLCFNCDYANTPKQCRTIARCDHGEVCMLTEIPPTVPGDYILYKSRCQRPQDCEQLFIIGRKRNGHCHVCCKDDFCNDNCTNSLTVTMTTVTTTTVATLTTSTVATLTTTPVATATTTTVASPSATTDPASSSTSTTLTTSVADSCLHNSGYQLAVNSSLCYKLHPDRKSWNDANATCSSEGGTLAITDTKEKWEYLKHQLQNNHNFHQDIYIGGRGVGHHSGDHFQWANGQSVTWSAWADHQPNDSGKHKRCIWLHYHEHFDWHDDHCDAKYVFICTINM